MSRFAHRNSSVSAALLLVVLDVVHHHRHWELRLCGIATRVATYGQVKDHEEPQKAAEARLTGRQVQIGVSLILSFQC